MTTLTLFEKNKQVLYAWGSPVTGTYLGFNLKHFVKLADDKGVDLWGGMMKVDAEVTMFGKVLVMEDLLEKLTN